MRSCFAVLLALGLMVPAAAAADQPVFCNLPAISLDGLKRSEDNTCSYVSLPPLAIGAPMTIEAWIRPTLMTGDPRDFFSTDTAWNLGYVAPTSNLISFAIGSGHENNRRDRLFAWIMTTQDRIASSTGLLTLNAWQHVGLTIPTTGDSTFYINGVSSGTLPSSEIPLPTAVNRAVTFIGRYVKQGHDTFAGQIKDLRIWKTARTQAEIQDFRSVPVAPYDNNLVAWYRTMQSNLVNPATDAPLADACTSGWRMGNGTMRNAAAFTGLTNVTEGNTVTPFSAVEFLDPDTDTAVTNTRAYTITLSYPYGTGTLSGDAAWLTNLGPTNGFQRNTVTGTGLATVVTRLRSVGFTPSGYLAAGISANTVITINANDGAAAATDVGSVTVRITGTGGSFPLSPTLESIDPLPLTYTENAGAQPVTSSLVVAYIDNANLTKATVEIFTNNHPDQDVLSLSLPNGSPLTVDPYNAASGILTINGSATKTVYQQALRLVQYTNTNLVAPSGDSRVLRFTIYVNESLSNQVTRTILVIPMNSPSVVGDVGSEDPLFFTEGDPSPRVVSQDLTVFDVDDTQLESATVTITRGFASDKDELNCTTPGAGITQTWNSTTGVLTLSGTATLDAYRDALRTVTYFNGDDDPIAGARDIAFSVNDGDVFSMAATRTVWITAVNDAPTLSAISDGPFAYTENHAAIQITNTIVPDDVDNLTLKSARIEITTGFESGKDHLVFTDMHAITGEWNSTSGTLTLSSESGDTLAHYQEALRSITYINDNENPTAGARTIRFIVNDGNADSNPRSQTINVTAVNDLPVLAHPDVSFLVHVSGPTPSPVLTDPTVTDVDNDRLLSATARITSGYQAGQDALTFTPTAETGNISSSWVAGTLTLTSSPHATLDEYEAALRAVSLSNTQASPVEGERVITFQVSDEDGGDSNLISRTVLVIDTNNDLPVVTIADTSAVTYEESIALGQVTELAFIADGNPGAGDVTVSDEDDLMMSAARIEIAAGDFAAGEDVLTFPGSGTITAATSGTGILILTGSATKAEYAAALKLVTYKNLSDTPTERDRHIAITVTDQHAGESIPVNRIVTVHANSDPPRVAHPITPATKHAITGLELVYTLPPTTFSDVDTPSLTYTLNPAIPGLTLNPTTGVLRGVIAAPTSSAVVFTASDGDNDALASFTLSVTTFVGTIPDQEAAIGQPFTFTVDAGAFMDAELSSGLSYTAQSVGTTAWPDWLHFDPVTRTFTGTPTSTTVGITHNIQVNASDRFSNTVPDRFLITVSPPYTAVAISISDTERTFDGNQKPVTVTTTPAGVAHTVTYSNGTNTWTTVTATTGVVTGTAPSVVGVYAVSVTITEPRHTGSATGTLTIAADRSIEIEPATEGGGSCGLGGGLTAVLMGLVIALRSAIMRLSRPTRARKELP